MAKSAARTRRAAGSRRGRRAASRRETRLHIDWRAHQLPLAGVGLVLAAGLLVHWVSGGVDLLTGLRGSIVGAVGVGVFVGLALVILFGLWLLAGAHAVRPGRLRRALGALVLIGFALGLAGAFHPAWELGEVRLDERSAGGDVGAWLASPLGALPMLGLFLTGCALIDPRRTWRGLRYAWQSASIGARRAAELAPSPWTGTPADPWAGESEMEGAGAVAAATGAAGARPSPPAAAAAGGTAVVAEAAAPPAGVEAAAGGSSAGEAASEETSEPPRRGRRRTSDGWQLPSLAILEPDPPAPAESDSVRQGEVIVQTLAQFGVDAKVTQIDEGPSVTQIGIEPGWEVRTRKAALRDAQGKPLRQPDGQPAMREEEVSRTRVRVNRITRLTNDLALALAAPSIRVLAPVPGKPVVGIEVPNRERRVVSLRGVIESKQYRSMLRHGGLPIALGRNVSGQPVVVDLTRMPHVLIAGATGAGKSVAINSIIAGLLMHFSPEALRFVMVDPKRVELTGYSDIPHLAFSHVVTDPEEVVGVLGVVVTEMERRYRRFEQVGARNIEAYNKEDRPEGPLPYWVVILDELADLMMAAPVEVEQQLVRLAQLARATGIHMVIATQRPSVDVVTGLIKANFPTRIAFATTSQTDARVIMDRAGAEKLLGRGDMLFMSQDSIQPQRVQGTFVSDDEIRRLIEFWTADRFKEVPRPTLDHLLAEAVESAAERAAAEAEEAERDSLFEDAAALAREHTRISTSMLQRRLRIGYPRAARLIDQLEAAGIVGASDGGQSRAVLVEADTLG